jgi:exportin-7
MCHFLAPVPLISAVLNSYCFRLLQEFVANKGVRISFDNSSANGILLFRETSAICCAYGSRILQVPVQQNIYLEKYKGIRLMLNTLTNALSGNYVNFGVFSLYNDQALQNALDVSLQMCLQIPVSDVIAYIKLSRAYFAFVEILFRNHLDVLCGLDSPVFIQLIKTNQEGLQSSGKFPCLFIRAAPLLTQVISPTLQSCQ